MKSCTINVKREPIPGLEGKRIRQGVKRELENCWNSFRCYGPPEESPLKMQGA